MIYNFPGAASGIDLDSDFLIELSELPNCFGAKVRTPSVLIDDPELTSAGLAAHLRRHWKGNKAGRPHSI